ncbi:MAG: o-succinylbenzoate synthase [Chlorobiaceae bacterium]|nr:o-succinylbenzoate synthase [Chlorobiaceae bacterium]
MILREFSYEPYELKLKKPLTIANKTILSRSGFLIKIESENGNVGIGDAAPFPEFGSESLSETKTFLFGLKQLLKLKQNKIDVNKLLEYRKNFFMQRASVAGIEQALLNLLIKENGISLEKYFDVNTKNEIQVNALVGFESLNETISLIENFIDEGYKTVKLKIGRENFFDDLKIISELRKRFNDKIIIRLDANCKWSLTEAKNNLKSLEDFSIEYVEQPIANVKEFRRINTTIPLAADESIRTIEDAETIIENELADIIILKPMLTGGLLNSIEIIKAAQKKNIKTVVTTSLDSAIGKRQAVVLASTLEHDLACGLSTSNLFESDIEEDIYPVVNGKIRINKLML